MLRSTSTREGAALDKVKQDPAGVYRQATPHARGARACSSRPPPPRPPGWTKGGGRPRHEAPLGLPGKRKARFFWRPRLSIWLLRFDLAPLQAPASSPDLANYVLHGVLRPPPAMSIPLRRSEAPRGFKSL